MNRDLLIKYLNNRCTAKEFDALARWILDESGGKWGKAWSVDDWRSFEPDLKKKDPEKYQALLDKIHHEINLRNKKATAGKILSIRKIGQWLGKAAAILFIPLLGAFFYMLSNKDIEAPQYTGLSVDSLEVIAPVGSRTVFQLSDGTTVHLNYGSRIKYPRHFAGDIRGIKLEGEGYFEVARNPARPFVVKTGKMNVKALGTKFNVQAYPDDEEVATTLVEGKVVLEKTSGEEGAGTLGAMVPGQHMVYHAGSDRILSSKGNIDKFIAWKDGRLVFDNEPITGVADKLGRMFNVDIEVTDDVKDLTYTVTFIDDPLFFILDLMKETTPVSYEAFRRKKLPNGSYTKQKILITRRQ